MVRARFRIGGLLSSADYVQAQRTERPEARICCRAPEGRCDCLADHVQSGSAFATVDGMTTARRPSFTGPVQPDGHAGHLSAGFTAAGLPVGLQIAGKPFDEPTVLRMAYTYQQHARWFEKRPPM